MPRTYEREGYKGMWGRTKDLGMRHKEWLPRKRG
jgi:hypothetical protein